MKISEITPTHLGSEATEADVSHYRDAIGRYMCSECGVDEEEAEEYLWGVGAFTRRWDGGHCIYCHQLVADGVTIPAGDDDVAWRALAVHHNPDCEWVNTRAHRRP